jgi:hypothetical protein
MGRFKSVLRALGVATGTSAAGWVAVAHDLGRSRTFLAMVLVVMGFYVGSVARRFHGHPLYKELPGLERLVVVAVDVITLGSLGTALESFRHVSGAPPRYLQINNVLSYILGAHVEAGTIADVKSTIWWYLRVYAYVARDNLEHWAEQVFPVMFPVFILLGGGCAIYTLREAERTGSPLIFCGLLLGVVLCLLLAGVGHVAASVWLHQVSMAATGVVVFSLSVYLWWVDTGFASGIPDILGRVAGVGFGISIMVWQWFARHDSTGETRCCNVAAFAAALVGGVLFTLNLADRMLTQHLGFTEIASSVWPLCVVGCATLAAIARREWGTGSRAEAVEGSQPVYVPPLKRSA